jgi:hypothetical protein
MNRLIQTGSPADVYLITEQQGSRVLIRYQVADILEKQGLSMPYSTSI